MENDVKFEVTAGFFDAINNDRVYSADDMNRPYRKLISNGVFATPKGEPSDYLQVFTANNGMNIIVSAGYALIGDKWFENPSNLTITTAQNSDVLTRIDSIIAQMDKTQLGRAGNIVYRKGTASSNPVHPSINTEENIIEFRLADITISPSCIKITQDLIKDCRGSSECPWVTSLIYQVDTSTLYAQWQEAYKKYYMDQEVEHDKYFNDFKIAMSNFLNQEENTFDTWFEKIKGQLSEDAAAKLQLLIDDLTLEIAKEKENHNNDIEKIAETMLDCISTENGEYIVSEDKEYIMVESENTNQNDEIRKILLDNDTIIVELIIKEKLCTIIAYTKDEACLDTYESSCSFDFEVPKEYLPNINMTSYSPNLYSSSSGEDAIISGFSELTILGKNSSDYGINMGIIQLQIVKERLQSFYTTISYYIDN